MEHQQAGRDAESLKIARRRSSCMDAFLVTSIILLFLAVGSIAGVVVMDRRSKDAVPKMSFVSQDDSQAPVYKMPNFAYLNPTSSDLTNGTMKWAPLHFGASTSVGSYSFDEDKHALQPKQEGTYFVYLDLKLTCTCECDAGLLTVRLGDKLTCRLELPKWAEEEPVTRKCWTVTKMDGVAEKPLVAQMTVPPQGLENWSLDLNDSKFGMFLMD